LFRPHLLGGIRCAAGAATIDAAYVRGSAWTAPFTTYMAQRGSGDAIRGYRIDDKPAGDLVPWVNVNEVVLHYATPPGGGGAPTAGSVVLDGIRSDYTVTSVSALDARTYALRLDRPLGTLPAPTGGTDGDRVALSVRGAVGGAFRINVLQGDVDRSGAVAANDYSDVKARFFSSTAAAGSGATGYTIFDDVNASGSILADDFSAVKQRFFDSLPPAPAPPASGAPGLDRPSITADWFAPDPSFS